MQRITKAVIPAAGFGTRFLPATKAQPKEMLTVVDKPVIQYIVEEAVASGITDIIIITGQSKRAIEDHFDRSFELEYRLAEQNKNAALKEVQDIAQLANFVYVRQKEAKGDGHALLEAYSLLRGEPFAVLFGDVVIDAPKPGLKQMIEQYEERGAPVIAVSKVPKKEVHRYGIIGGERLRPNLYQMTKLVEKPSLAEAPSNLAAQGRYIFTPELLETLRTTKHRKGQELRIADALATFVQKNPAFAYIPDGTWYDCGDKFGFLRATIELGLKHKELRAPLKRYLHSL